MEPIECQRSGLFYAFEAIAFYGSTIEQPGVQMRRSILPSLATHSKCISAGPRAREKSVQNASLQGP